MNPRIEQLVQKIEPHLIAMRRDFHRYPEPGWTEFRTASFVVKRLKELQFDVLYGGEVVKEEAMMGVPSKEELDESAKRAISEGADPEIVAAMAGGKTGVVGILETGRPGPTLGFRVDMDANDVDEAKDPDHRPVREGFASTHPGAMHACGHDAHTAIGLGLAEVLAELKDELKGKIKLVFQPAEEGVRGARAMAEAGVVDDVDYMIGVHVGVRCKKLGELICGGTGFLATTKLDVTYEGVPAHAGAEPHLGKNALLAAATAVLNLHAIPRHGEGATRINVGTLRAGTGRNVIPAKADMKIETRGVTTELNEFMKEKALQILKGSAAMHDVRVEIVEAGGALGGEPSEGLVLKVAEVAKTIPDFSEIHEYGPGGGSEDYTYFMSRVQQKGGEGTFIYVGTELAAGHHNSRFDINEKVIPLAVKLLAELTLTLAK